MASRWGGPTTKDKKAKANRWVVASGGTSSSPGSDVIELAKREGIEVPAQKPSLLSRVISGLNKPSEITEKFITRGSTYTDRLNQVGIRDTKGKLDVNDVASFAGKMVLDPLNLVGPAAKVLGVGSKFAKGAEVAGSVASKIPGVAAATSTAGELFVPGYKLAKTSKPLAEALPALETAIRAKQVQGVRSVAELAKGFSPEIRDNIGKLVEKAGAGEKLTAAEQDAVQKTLAHIQTTITGPEQAAGLLPKEIANYFPRKAEQDALKQHLGFGGDSLSLNTGGLKARKYATQVEGEKAGVIYKNSLEALGIRTSKSVAAQENAKFLGQLTAGEIKDNAGKALLQPLKKPEDLADGMTAIRIDKNGLRVGDKFLGFYPTVSEKGNKIVGVTTRGGNFQVPKEVAPDLQKYFNKFITDDGTNEMLKFYDKALGVWKGSVTSLFPAFHIRNMIGNLSNMWLGGFNPQDLPKLATAARIQKGEEVVVKGIKVGRDMLEQHGVIGTGQFGADVPKVLEGVLGKQNLLNKANPFAVGRKFGTAVEDNSKIAFFLQRLSKGDDIPQAVAQTKKYLFDYNDLTPFEQGALKRVIPFYTWARKNIPLQIESLVTKPARQAAITKTFANLSPLSDKEKAVLPNYYQEGLTAKLPWNPKKGEGDINVLTGTGLPFEDIGRLNRGSASRTFEREVLGAAGPLGNLLGIAQKRDFYRGKDTSELDYTYGKMASKYPDPIKKLLGYTETKSKTGATQYHVDPTKFQILQTVAGRVLRTTSDPTSGLNFAKISPIDLKKSQESKQREIEDQLAKALQEKGLSKVFTKYYIPSK